MAEENEGKPDGVTGDHPGTGTGSDDKLPGDGGDKSPDGLSAAAAAKIDEGKAAAKAAEPPADGRPEHIPEQFWKAGEGEAEGTINTEAMAKSWQDTRKELTDLKANQGTGKAPDKADDYVFTPPTDTKVPYDNLKDDDAGMAAIKQAAHAAGLDTKQYQTLVETFFENCPDAIMAPFDEKAEMEIIGKNGQAVIDENVRWLMGLIETGVLSQDEYDEMMIMGATGYGVRGLAKLRAEATGEKAIPLNAPPIDGALPSKAELYAMQADPKYGSDPGFRAKVDKQFEAVYGNQPAGSSDPNMGVGHTNTPPANIRRADELLKKAAD